MEAAALCSMPSILCGKKLCIFLLESRILLHKALDALHQSSLCTTTQFDFVRHNDQRRRRKASANVYQELKRIQLQEIASRR